MRIIMIGQKGIPAVYGGGVETHVDELSTRLVQAGHEVIVYARSNYSDIKNKEYKGVKLVFLPSIKTKHLDAISHTFLACINLIFTKKVDIIHFHAIGPSSLIWLVKIFKPRTKIVFTFHCQDYYHQKWNWFARNFLKVGEYLAVKIADSTIVVSKGLKKYADEEYNKNTIYIPNGTNIFHKLESDQIKKWDLEKDNYILSTSRLVKHKGIHYLIKAFNKLKTDKKLVIAGDGAFTDGYIDDIKKLASSNKNIIFVGNQTGMVLRELYSNACLFVQPSESEGLSMSLLEAMSYALPIIISDIPENIEAVGDGGLYFENKNYKDLKDKIYNSLYNEDKVKALGLRAKEKVNRCYNLDSITKATISVYNSLLK